MKNKMTIPALRIKITGKCNRSCFFCNKEGGMKSILDVRPDNEFSDVLGALKDELGISRVMITGGEPTISPGLEKIVSLINTPEISITSNGALLKTPGQWKELRDRGLTKLIISIHDVSPLSLLNIESRAHGLDWANGVIQNQLTNISNAVKAGIEVRTNTVVYGDCDNTLEVINALKILARTNWFEIRLLNDLSNIEKSKRVILQICDKLNTRTIRAYQKIGSSNVTKYHQAIDGLEIAIKQSFSYFFNPVCDGCPIRDRGECFEGFYGLRLERKNTGYFVRMCVYRQDSGVLMPWKKFLSSDLPKKLKDIFREEKI